MAANRVLRFLIPSLVGVLFFLTPITDGEGKSTILIGLIVSTLEGVLGPILDGMVAVLFATSAIGALLATVFPKLTAGRPLMQTLFDTTWPWLTFRLVGGIFATMTVTGIGPDWVIGENTGQVGVEIGGLILLIMLLANYLLPLLVDFGLLEYIGTLVTNIFKKVFRLPGRAGLDAITSWVGDSSVGALLTIRQYEQGAYSAREAAVVVTNFSAVSLPFTVVVTEIANLEVGFVTFYGVAIVIGLIAALITPRLPPLSRLPDTYMTERPPEPEAQGSIFAQAWHRALNRAANAPPPGVILRRGTHSTLDVLLAVLPAAMAIEFLALLAYEYTSIFYWLSYPLLPLLHLFQVASPEAVLPGTLVGFFDQFVPAIIAESLSDAKARFVLAGLSITQLIFIAENGALILRSAIPIHIGQLFAVFVIRTLIALPILSLAAHALH